MRTRDKLSAELRKVAEVASSTNAAKYEAFAKRAETGEFDDYADTYVCPITQLYTELKAAGFHKFASREGETIWAACQRAHENRVARMPDERSALQGLHDAYTRLRDMGWRDAIYCPKDGSSFEVIEVGSTGIHRAHYQGEWPTGSWWIEESGDLSPSRPAMFRLLPEDQIKEDARREEARKRFAEEREPRTAAGSLD